MKIISFIVVLALITGCTKQAFTDEERTQLSDVMFAELVVSEKAYQNPDAANWNRRDGSAAAMGAAMGGLAGGLLTTAINSGILYSQREAYDKVASEFFASIEENMPDIAPLTESKVKEAFESNPFFAKRIQESSSNQIKIELLRYGFITTADLFMKSNFENTELETAAKKRQYDEKVKQKQLDHEMQFLVAVRISLLGAAGDEIAKRYFEGISETKAPLATYTGSPENIDEVASESINIVYDSLTTFIEDKTVEN